MSSGMWGFLTANSVAWIAVLGTVISARSTSRRAAHSADRTRRAVPAAFAATTTRQLTSLQDSYAQLEAATAANSRMIAAHIRYHPR